MIEGLIWRNYISRQDGECGDVLSGSAVGVAEDGDRLGREQARVKNVHFLGFLKCFPR